LPSVRPAAGGSPSPTGRRYCSSTTWSTATTTSSPGSRPGRWSWPAGVYSREGKTDARDLSWSITGTEGGADAAEEEVRRLAEFLRSVEIEPQAVETMKEHVRESRLSAYIDPEAVRSTRDRTRGRRDIARDL
jgi:hypothetical protein